MFQRSPARTWVWLLVIGLLPITLIGALILAVFVLFTGGGGSSAPPSAWSEHASQIMGVDAEDWQTDCYTVGLSQHPPIPDYYLCALAAATSFGQLDPSTGQPPTSEGIVLAGDPDTDTEAAYGPLLIWESVLAERRPNLDIEAARKEAQTRIGALTIVAEEISVIARDVAASEGLVWKEEFQFLESIADEEAREALSAERDAYWVAVLAKLRAGRADVPDPAAVSILLDLRAPFYDSSGTSTPTELLIVAAVNMEVDKLRFEEVDTGGEYTGLRSVLGKSDVKVDDIDWEILRDDLLAYSYSWSRWRNLNCSVEHLDQHTDTSPAGVFPLLRQPTEVYSLVYTGNRCNRKEVVLWVTQTMIQGGQYNDTEDPWRYQWEQMYGAVGDDIAREWWNKDATVRGDYPTHAQVCGHERKTLLGGFASEPVLANEHYPFSNFSKHLDYLWGPLVLSEISEGEVWRPVCPKEALLIPQLGAEDTVADTPPEFRSVCGVWEAKLSSLTLEQAGGTPLSGTRDSNPDLVEAADAVRACRFFMWAQKEVTNPVRPRKVVELGTVKRSHPLVARYQGKPGSEGYPVLRFGTSDEWAQQATMLAKSLVGEGSALTFTTFGASKAPGFAVETRHYRSFTFSVIGSEQRAGTERGYALCRVGDNVGNSDWSEQERGCAEFAPWEEHAHVTGSGFFIESPEKRSRMVSAGGIPGLRDAPVSDDNPPLYFIDRDCDGTTDSYMGFAMMWETQEAWDALCSDAARLGIPLVAGDGNRPFATQIWLFNFQGDALTAKPGRSYHGFGAAVDVDVWNTDDVLMEMSPLDNTWVESRTQKDVVEDWLHTVFGCYIYPDKAEELYPRLEADHGVFALLPAKEPFTVGVPHTVYADLADVGREPCDPETSEPVKRVQYYGLVLNSCRSKIVTRWKDNQTTRGRWVRCEYHSANRHHAREPWHLQIGETIEPVEVGSYTQLRCSALGDTEGSVLSSEAAWEIVRCVLATYSVPNPPQVDRATGRQSGLTADNNPGDGDILFNTLAERTQEHLEMCLSLGLDPQQFGEVLAHRLKATVQGEAETPQQYVDRVLGVGEDQRRC